MVLPVADSIPTVPPFLGASTQRLVRTSRTSPLCCGGPESCPQTLVLFLPGIRQDGPPLSLCDVRRARVAWFLVNKVRMEMTCVSSRSEISGPACGSPAPLLPAKVTEEDAAPQLRSQSGYDEKSLHPSFLPFSMRCGT